MRDAQNVAELLVKACKRPTRRRLRSIHGAVIEADTLAVADLWLEELTRLQARCRCGPPSRTLACQHVSQQGDGEDRVALLGATGCDGHVDVIVRRTGAGLRSIAHCSPRLATSSELIDGPAQDIDNYADGDETIEHFLALMRGPAPSHFLITVR